MNAEQAVLGGVLIAPEKFADIADKLTASDFLGDAHKKIWQSFVDLDKAGKPLDLVSMIPYVDDHRYLHELHKNTPTAANLKHYVEMVKNESLERRLLAAGSEVMEIAKSKGKIREKLDKAVTRLMSVAENKTDDGPKSAKSYLPAWVEMLEKRNDHLGELIGVSTGLKDLDEMTAGLQETDLIIVAGRPSMGKTTLAMNFAEQVAIRDKQTALVFSMEMSAEQLITRSVSSLGTVDQSRLRLAQLEDGEWGKVTNATAMINESSLVIDETPGLTILDLRARAKRVHRRTPLSLIVVDYIQLMAGKGDNQNLIVSDISRGLKALAKELRVPVVALSQLNRGLEQRTDKRPRMADLRDSGAIEQDADLVMFVYRDEVYNDDTPNKGVAEIILGKQRNGPTGKVHASFQGQYCRFKNFIGSIAEDIPTDRWSGGFNG